MMTTFTKSVFKSIHTLALSSVVFFAGASALATPDWSQKAACQNVFFKFNQTQANEAVNLITNLSSDTNAIGILQSHNWASPKVWFFAGPEKSGKTKALNYTVLPALRTHGFSVAKVESAELLQILKDSSATTAFKDFDIVAIDDVDFTTLSYERYLSIVEFTRERFSRGQSTILALKNHKSVDLDEDGNLTDDQMFLQDFSQFSTRMKQDDVFYVNFDLRPHMTKRH